MIKDKQIRLLKPNKKFELFDHFLNAPTVAAGVTDSVFSSPFNWYINTSGTGSGVGASAGLATNPGIISMQTGTVAGSSRTAITSFPSTLSGTTNAGSIILGSAAIELEFMMRFTLGNSTNDHECWIGFGDSSTNAPVNFGAYIYQDYSVNSNQWQYIYRTSSTASTVALSGSVATNAFTRFNIKFSKSPVKVTFSINGGSSYTAPATYTDGTPVGIQLVTQKYAGTVSQAYDFDYIRLNYNAS